MSNRSLKVLVYGATGTQSSPIVHQLLAAGHVPYAVTRNPNKASALKDAGAHLVHADMGDIDALTEASRGMDAVALLIPFFINPMDAPKFAENAIHSAKAGGVRQIVWNTSGALPPAPTGNPGVDIRLHVLTLLRESGLPYVVIEPGAYIENLLGPWTAPSVAERSQLTYPMPPHIRVGWITTEDVCAFMVYALEHPELAGQVITISGSEPVTGPELAQRFSQGLGRPIEYVAMQPDEFGAVLDQVFGPGAGAAASSEYSKLWANPEQPPVMHTDMAPILARMPVKMTSIVEWASRYAGAFSPQ